MEVEGKLLPGEGITEVERKPLPGEGVTEEDLDIVNLSWAVH